MSSNQFVEYFVIIKYIQISIFFNTLYISLEKFFFLLKSSITYLGASN